VHPSEDAVLSAVEKLGGHKIGHSEKSVDAKTSGMSLLSA